MDLICNQNLFVSLGSPAPAYRDSGDADDTSLVLNRASALSVSFLKHLYGILQDNSTVEEDIIFSDIPSDTCNPIVNSPGDTCDLTVNTPSATCKYCQYPSDAWQYTANPTSDASKPVGNSPSEARRNASIKGPKDSIVVISFMDAIQLKVKVNSI